MKKTLLVASFIFTFSSIIIYFLIKMMALDELTGNEANLVNFMYVLPFAITASVSIQVHKAFKRQNQNYVQK